MQSTVTWLDGMALAAELDGHTLTLDLGLEAGGGDRGPRPKGLVLTALAGCTAMDLVSILQKMRQPLAGLRVLADGATVEEHPRRITRIALRYELSGEGLSVEKVRRAVELSQDRYCGVSATLRPTVEITSEILINGQPI